MINYIVIEGSHINPNEMSTIDEKSKKEINFYSYW